MLFGLKEEDGKWIIQTAIGEMAGGLCSIAQIKEAISPGRAVYEVHAKDGVVIQRFCKNILHQ